MVLTLPIVIPAVFVVMYLRDREIAPIAHLSRQTLMLIPLGLPFFIPMAMSQRWGLSFWSALAMGLVLVSASVSAYLWMTR